MESTTVSAACRQIPEAANHCLLPLGLGLGVAPAPRRRHHLCRKNTTCSSFVAGLVALQINVDFPQARHDRGCGARSRPRSTIKSTFRKNTTTFLLELLVLPLFAHCIACLINSIASPRPAMYSAAQHLDLWRRSSTEEQTPPLQKKHHLCNTTCAEKKTFSCSSGLVLCPISMKTSIS